MSIIAMAVYSTEENKKDKCLEKTLASLHKTVDWKKHKIMLSINGYTQTTKDIIYMWGNIIHSVYWNETNLGTAEAVNKCWASRTENEHCIKIDDDIVIHYEGWVEELEAVVAIDPKIGQAALKRKDLRQCPQEESEWFKSELVMLPHKAGERWMVVERTLDIMGSCVLHSADLINKVGGLRQFGLYGFEDSLCSIRSRCAGFYNVFLPHIEIDHIDEGGTEYQKWKEKEASLAWQKFLDLAKAYEAGKEDLYHQLNK
jgi:glycosyltransferase involved in cell wall biosynthesis